jgi:hypothetical protein
LASIAKEPTADMPLKRPEVGKSKAEKAAFTVENVNSPGKEITVAVCAR